MKIALLTNMLSHHQMPLFKALQRHAGVDNVRLIALLPTASERTEMGWSVQNREPGIICVWESEDQQRAASLWIDTADVVIQGRYPIEHVRARILAGKLTFAYQERLWKKGFYRPSTLTRVYRLYQKYWSVNRPNYHFLASGKYASGDVTRLGCFRQRTWKFGYFIDPPDWERSEEDEYATARVLWCGRMIEAKRPALAIEMVRRAHQSGASLRLKMVGDGPRRAEIERSIRKFELGRIIELTGVLPLSRVYQEMQTANIFLFTSNRRDGWGVVVNEAMSYGCCTIASDAVGGPCWLIDHGWNGLLFDGGDVEQGASHLARVALDGKYRHRLGNRGAATLRELWSADSAGIRVIGLAEELLSGRSGRDLYATGPCSAC